MSQNFDLRELQLRLVDIMEVVDKVCRENNLRYYLLAGTLIGAVRHKGFIPWDDDMDIAMPRRDYKIFMDKAKELLPESIEGVDWRCDPEFPFYHGKVQDRNTTLVEKRDFNYVGGIFIDVFPLDGVPKNKLVRFFHLQQFNFYNKFNYFLHRNPYKHGVTLGTYWSLALRYLFSREKITQKLVNIMAKYDFDDSEFVCDYNDGKEGILPKKVFEKTEELIFEGRVFLGIKDYHSYLSNKYGDYMTVPPPENQIQHDFKVIDFNKSYREYVAQQKASK